MVKETTKPTNPEWHDKTDLFEFETDNGSIRLPYLENLPLAIIEDAAGKSVDEFFKIAFAELMDDDAVKIRRAMTLLEYNAMVEAWNQESAINLGELFA